MEINATGWALSMVSVIGDIQHLRQTIVNDRAGRLAEPAVQGEVVIDPDFGAGESIGANPGTAQR